MKTVKLKISNIPDVRDDIRIYSSIVRYSFNRFQDGLNEKEIRYLCKEKFICNSWIILCAIKDAEYLFNINGSRKVIFGGKSNLYRYLHGVIDKNEYKANRLQPLTSQGQMNCKGNRLFSFDFDQNHITYKPSRHRHADIYFLPMRTKITNELKKVQELANNGKISVTVKISEKFVWLTYDESIIYNNAFNGLKPNRTLGIDMNPNYIGVSVVELNPDDTIKVLHKQVFDLSKITVTSRKTSTDKKSKYLTNKLRHETIDIAHQICNLVNIWKCKTISIEDLTIKPSDKQKGTWFNRLCNNKWERALFVNKLKMLASIHRFNIVEVNPAYSSIVGNIAYGNDTTPDMVAASIEIARRAFKKYEKGWFYPRFNIQFRDEQWKQTLGSVENWKGLFSKIKETGLKYRFLLKDYVQNAVFSKDYKHKCYNIYVFK